MVLSSSSLSSSSSSSSSICFGLLETGCPTGLQNRMSYWTTKQDVLLDYKTGCPTGLPNVFFKTDDFRKVVFWH
jgi:hypothetical protein